MSSKKNKSKPKSRSKPKAASKPKSKSKRPSVSRAKSTPKAPLATAPVTPAKQSGASKLCKCGCEGKTENTFVRGHYGTYLNLLRKADSGALAYVELPAGIKAALPTIRHVRGELARLKPMGTPRKKKKAA